MLRQAEGSRRFNDKITLTKSAISIDDYGHASVGATTPVLVVYAQVRQMSATKAMLTYQQADIVALEIEFRSVDVDFDGIEWRGHRLNFSAPESVDNRGRYTRLTAYYQQDTPKA